MFLAGGLTAGALCFAAERLVRALFDGRQMPTKSDGKTRKNNSEKVHTPDVVDMKDLLAMVAQARGAS